MKSLEVWWEWNRSGNIEATSRVDLLESGILIGDLKARSMTVAAGSFMRGRVEFGRREGEAERALVGGGDL